LKHQAAKLDRKHVLRAAANGAFSQTIKVSLQSEKTTKTLFPRTLLYSPFGRLLPCCLGVWFPAALPGAMASFARL